MKNLTFLFALFLFFGCSDDDTSSDNTESNLIIYKNQTEDNNADALQAQYKDLEGTLNFYGNFDEELNPTTIRTLTYQKTFNDTIVNLIIDPLTNKLASSYTTVNGVKSNIVMKFAYPSTESLSVSVHEYDWDNMTSDIIFGVNLDRPNNDSASRSSSNSTSNWEVVGVMAAVAEVGLFLEGGLAGTWFVGPIALGLVQSAVAFAIANPLSAVTIALAAVLLIPSDAFSGELEPSDLPYPEDTEIENPVITEEEDPTPNLTPFDCAGVPISFELIMDQDGTIVLTEVNGSEGPYIYAIGEDVRDYPIFPNDYGNGFYLACVKDANNCISCRAQELIRPTACAEDTFDIVITTTSNSATAGVSGGEPPYVYLWSNGSNGPTANNLSEGTYTVSITDQNGCTNTAEVVITQENNERLLAYISYDKIVELSLENGEEIDDIAILGSDYFTDFVFLKQSNELVCHNFDNTYKINLSNGNLSILSNNYLEYLITSNTTNKLYGVSTSGDIYDINLSDGTETLVINGIGSTDDIVLLESSNEIIYNNDNGTFVFNLDTSQTTQLNNENYENLFVSQTQNKLYAYISYDRVVEISTDNGSETNVIILGNQYYGNFVFNESLNEIYCTSSGDTYKIDITSSSISQLNSVSYERLFMIY